MEIKKIRRSIFVDTNLILGNTILKEPVLNVIKEQNLIVKLTHIQIDEMLGLGLLTKEVKDYNSRVSNVLNEFKCRGLNVEMVAAPIILGISRLGMSMFVTNWTAKHYYEFVGSLVLEEGIFTELLKREKLEETEVERLGKRFRSIIADASILLSVVMNADKGDIFATGDKKLYQVAERSLLGLYIIYAEPDRPDKLA